MPHLTSLPDDATLIDVFKRHPQMASALLALHETIMRHSSPFSPAEREAIAAYVSTINECRYCKGVHTVAAVELGETADNVATICERPQSPDNLRLAPVLTYVGKLTSSPASVSQNDVQNILDAGWDEDAVSYASFVAALYAFMNRLVEGHGIVGTEDYYRAGGKRLAEIGYQGLAGWLEESSR